nr:phasin family protein [Paenibacillus humicola]
MWNRRANKMNDLFKKAVSLGVGLTIASKEKVEKLVEELVQKGEVAPAESKELVADLIAKGQEGQNELKKMVREQLQKLLAELNVASKDEVARLESRIAELEQQQSKPEETE